MHRLYSVALPLIVAGSGAIPIAPPTAVGSGTLPWAATATAIIPTIPTIPTLRPPAPPPSGIVATQDGSIYFVDSFHRMVWRLDPGRALSAYVTGRNGRTIQLDEAGNLYGTHEDSNGRVTMWRADCHGQVEDLSVAEVPRYGHAFVVEEDGEVISSSGSGKRTGVRLWRAREHEKHLLAGGDMGFRDGAGSSARFLPIGSMTLTRSGELLVTSGHTIRRVGSDGIVRTVTADEKLLKPRSSFLSRLLGDVQGHLTGIAVGEHGEIYVANSAREVIVRIDPDGTARDIVAAADGWSPTGVATANGAVYILEYGPGVRVRRVDAKGAVSVLAIVRPDPSLATAAFPFTRGSARG